MTPWGQERFPDIEAVVTKGFGCYMCYGHTNILGATKQCTTFTYSISKQTTKSIKLKNAQARSS